MDAPEPYTAAWYRQQFVGVNHRLNQQANEQSDQYAASKELQKRVLELEAADKNKTAKIGELMGRLEEVEAWMKQMEQLRQERLKQKSA